MQVVIGPEIIKSYKRLSYTPWHAFAEFVDNSTQSFIDNQDELTGDGQENEPPLRIDIAYNRAGSGSITVSDNAMGMSSAELASALHIGRPPIDMTGRSEFGMGLKTAACWFGNRWSVSTTKLGESGGHEIQFDVEKVASGNSDVQYRELEAERHEHYTVVKIDDLNQRMTRHEIGRVKRFLASIYREDIGKGVLLLTFNGDRIAWESPVDAGNVHISSDGHRCFFEFPKFDINNKSITGWIAVLARGSREDAGFTIIRRGRVIRGYPDAWRPRDIFGQPQGSNDLVSQRLVGEIHLNDFGVSHTKDGILWEEGEEGSIGLALQRISQEYVDIARSYRKTGRRRGSPSRSTINTAIALLEEEMDSPILQQVIATNGTVPQERYEQLADPMMRVVESNPPTKMYHFNGVTVFIYLAEELPQTDPYLGVDIRADGIVSVAINMNHPHFKSLNGSLGVFNHLKSCTYEGLAQWKVQNTWQNHSPAAMRAIKDALLRVGQSTANPTE